MKTRLSLAQHNGCIPLPPSMEFSNLLRDVQLRNLTTLCINSVRKEAWIGGKDGSIRGYDLTNNIFKFRSREHSGLVVRILCWYSQRLMISVGVDGAIIFWSSGALAADKVFLGEPIYHAAVYGRKYLVIATKVGCKIFNLDAHKLSGHYVALDKVHTVAAHKDYVRSLAAQDTRLYSGGMDGTFVIYEHGHGLELHASHVIRRAHASGITAIEPCRNFDEEGWLVATGSYDRHVKIWSNDGQLVHVISGFAGSISSLAYIRLTHQLWVASSAPFFTVVDPRSGEDVSEWNDAWQKFAEDHRQKKRLYNITFLCYSRELEVLVAQADVHCLMHWFYNARACMVSIPCPKPVESMTFTIKEPMLFFTGDSAGQLLKWEKAGFNTLKFSHEVLTMQRKLNEAPVCWQTSSEPKNVAAQHVAEKIQVTPSTFIEAKYYAGKKTDEHEVSSELIECSPRQKVMWIESLDMLIVADERGVMYVWAYDDVETKAQDFADAFFDSSRNLPQIYDQLKRDISSASWSTPRTPPTFSRSTKPEIHFSKKPQIGKSLGNTDVEEVKQSKAPVADWMTYKHYLNRASGFYCRFILWGHDACVSGIDYIHDQKQDLHVLISTSWDRRIITWNLKTGQILDVCKRDKTEPKVVEERETPGEYELVADGQITDVSYCALRNEVAYSSRDAHLYVRKFSTSGRKMKLIKKWLGHNGEALQVKWMGQRGTWVSSGVDGTIRLWSAEQLGTRLALVHCNNLVQTLSLDMDYGWILAAVKNDLQLFDPETLVHMRTHTGHQQLITGITHVHHLYSEPHYVTSSFDGTIKIWKACIKIAHPQS